MLDVEEYMFVGAVVAAAWTTGADLLLLVSAYAMVMAVFTCITPKHKERLDERLDVQTAADNTLRPNPRVQRARLGRKLPPRIARGRKMTRHAMRPKQRLCAMRLKQRLCAMRLKQKLCAVRLKQKLCAMRLKQKLCAVRPKQRLCAMRPKQRLCAVRPKQRLCAVRPKQRLCAMRPKQWPN